MSLRREGESVVGDARVAVVGSLLLLEDGEEMSDPK